MNGSKPESNLPFPDHTCHLVRSDIVAAHIDKLNKPSLQLKMSRCFVLKYKQNSAAMRFGLKEAWKKKQQDLNDRLKFREMTL